MYSVPMIGTVGRRVHPMNKRGEEPPITWVQPEVTLLDYTLP